MTKRKKGESYDDYKLRRKLENELTRKKLKGTLYWNSANRGTYTKEKENEIYREHKDDIEKNYKKSVESQK